MNHGTDIDHRPDGDYVVWRSLRDGDWVIHSWLLIPGTQVEDAA